MNVDNIITHILSFRRPHLPSLCLRNARVEETSGGTTTKGTEQEENLAGLRGEPEPVGDNSPSVSGKPG